MKSGGQLHFEKDNNPFLFAMMLSNSTFKLPRFHLLLIQPLLELPSLVSLPPKLPLFSLPLHLLGSRPLLHPGHLIGQTGPILTLLPLKLLR